MKLIRIPISLMESDELVQYNKQTINNMEAIS